MNKYGSLFDRIISEVGKLYSKPEKVIDTIDNRWDHVAIQAFLFQLGKKLGFRTGCEKFNKWDVAWRREGNHVHVEIELGGQTLVARAFSKICKESENLIKLDSVLFGILVINGYLIEEFDRFKDYLFEFVLNPEELHEDVYYPQKRTLDLLIIDIERKRYRYVRVGPERKHQNIKIGSLI